MRNFILSFSILFITSLNLGAQILLDNDKFTLEMQWNLPTAFYDYEIVKTETDFDSWGYSPFFIVEDNIVYFTSQNSSYNNRLLTVDGSSGKVIGLVNIDWGTFSHQKNFPAAYIGRDSNGEPYLASKGYKSADGKTIYTFDIYPVELKDDVAVVTEHYNIPLKSNTVCIIQSVDVYGSLSDGDFTVAAISWDKNNLSDVKDKRLLLWRKTADADEVSSSESYSLNGFKSTVSDMKLFSDNKIAFHDRNYIGLSGGKLMSNDAGFRHPTIYDIEDGKLITSTGIENETDGFGAGMASFTLGDKKLMLYAANMQPYEFKIIELNSHDSFDNPSELLTIRPEGWLLNYIYNSNLDRSPVYVENDSNTDNQANIYVGGTAQGGMAKYVLTAKEQTVTGIENITAEDMEKAEYYDLTGRRLTVPPTRGLYLKRTGTSTMRLLRP